MIACMRAKRLLSDRLLIRLCIRRNRASWALFVSRYSPLVETSAVNSLKKYGVILSKEDIEDIRQDVFSSIWRLDKLRDVSGRSDISCWLAVVSANAAISHIRKASNRERLRAVSIYEKIEEELIPEILSSGRADPEECAERSELALKINEAISSLPRLERLVIKLHMVHDKKHAEIADMLGLPIGTVCSYVKRSRDRLKYMLKDFLIFFAIFSPLLASIYMGGL
jgi:RNA polymerase sigma-70 factor (ECF subfamily)